VGAGLGQQMVQQTGQMVTQLPPTPPAIQFHVVSDGKTTGPFAVAVLQQMITAGTFNTATLVWRQGMASWQTAGTVPELASLFAPVAPPPVPPPIPPAS